MMQRPFEIRPAGDQLFERDLERRSLTVEIDPDHVAPEMGADLDQAQRIAVDAGMGVLARAADMGRADQSAVGGIAPRMVGAADHAFEAAGFFHEAVTADVLEDAHGARAVADQQKRHAEKGDRHRIAVFRYVGADCQPGPLAGKQRAGFFLVDRVVRVMGVGEARGSVDLLAHRGERGETVGRVLGHRHGHTLR